MPTALKRARDWKPRFLAELAKDGVIKRAAEAAGVDRTTVWQHRQKDAKFEAAYLDALDDAADILEADLSERVLQGSKRTKIETITDLEGRTIKTTKTIENTKSDACLFFRLKALRPEKYRDNYDLKNVVAALAMATGNAGGGDAGTPKAPARKRSDRGSGGQ